MALAFGVACHNPVQPSPRHTITLPTVLITVSNDSVAYLESVQMTWSATDADECEASGAWSGTKPPVGALSIAPRVWSTYVLTCYGPGGSAADSVRAGPYAAH